jgi:O-antigen ligase
VAAEGRSGPAIAGAVAAAAALIGLLIGRSPALAALALLALAAVVGTMRFGAVAVVVPGFALLPWLVVLEGVLPRVVGTFTAAIAAASLLAFVAPLRFSTPLVPVAGFVFVAIVLTHAVYATEGEQAIQAAKYMVFPAMVLAVSTERARQLLPSLKTAVLASGLAAMVFHLGVIAVGAGSTSTYYEAGEKLGFAAHGPHALALMAMVVAAAGLTVERLRYQLAFFALGAVPVVLSGVRSALLGLAVILLIYVIQSPRKGRALLVLGAVAAVGLAAGGMDVITARFTGHPEEFSSFSTAGSGRGEIWGVAFDAWGAAGPVAWFFGTGLRSIVDFELAALGAELVGHSDIVEVLVQLGIVGFAAWLALWTGLLRAGLRAIVLLPILAFGIVNGTLEYVAPLTAGLFLAAACATPRDGPLPDGAPEPEGDLVERGAGDAPAGALPAPALGVGVQARVGVGQGQGFQ